MKKVYLIIIVISLLVLGGCTYIDSLEQRIRIISSSNEEQDVNDKYLVRDVLLDIFYYDQIEVNNNSIKTLENKLKEKTGISLVVEYKNETFPAKVQNGKFIPSGTYKTLLITIGSGNGSNWWSVLYPEFYGIGYEDATEVEYRSFIYDLIKE